MDDYPLQGLLDACIAANQAIHDRVAPTVNTKGTHVRSYLADYRTIRLDVGMRSGKSTTIVQGATAEDVIVCGSQTHYDSVFRRVDDIKADVIIASQTLRVDRTYKRVWLDEPRLVFQYISPGFMYELLGKDKDQLFILLGP